MIVIDKPRGCGKTYELLKISSKKHIPIICTSSVKRRFLLEYAKRKNMKIPMPIVFIGDRSVLYGRRDSEYLIDDAEYFIAFLLGKHIRPSAITITSGDDNKLPSKFKRWFKRRF